MTILSGLKVLEIAALGPVPWCGMLLADMGASLVRVDRPGSSKQTDTLGAVQRGRLSMEIDLKTESGRAHALSLATQADVLIEGFRPGVMERLSLGPKECQERNPRLVYGRMTGWGQDGPLAQQAGHDINYIALTGALHAIGTAAQPIPPLNVVGDFGGGGAFLAMGVLAAVLESRTLGRGRVVDAAMVDGSASLMAMAYSRMHMGQWRDERASNVLDGGAPWYNTYRTLDNRFMAVGAIEPQFYSQFVTGLGLHEAALPARTDQANWPALKAKFASIFQTRTRNDWAAHFHHRDACVSPVLTMTEAPDHPHLVARSTFVSWAGKPVPSVAPRFSGVTPVLAPCTRCATWEEIQTAWNMP